MSCSISSWSVSGKRQCRFCRSCLPSRCYICRCIFLLSRPKFIMNLCVCFIGRGSIFIIWSCKIMNIFSKLLRCTIFCWCFWYILFGCFNLSVWRYFFLYWWIKFIIIANVCIWWWLFNITRSTYIFQIFINNWWSSLY